jgi:hypothetical protein
MRASSTTLIESVHALGLNGWGVSAFEGVVDGVIVSALCCEAKSQAGAMLHNLVGALLQALADELRDALAVAGVDDAKSVESAAFTVRAHRASLCWQVWRHQLKRLQSRVVFFTEGHVRTVRCSHIRKQLDSEAIRTKVFRACRGSKQEKGKRC